MEAAVVFPKKTMTTRILAIHKTKYLELSPNLQDVKLFSASIDEILFHRANRR